MSHRYDPRERWRWEEEPRARDEYENLGRNGRFARDAGDPRWGTGGMRVDERVYRALRDENGEREWARGEVPRETAVRPSSSYGSSYVEWDNSSSRGPYTGIGPRGYRRSDERVREEVCERFAEHGQLDPSDIEVSVRDGEVLLAGTVATRVQKRLAEDIADLVFGVVEVHNRLRVQRPGEEAHSSSSREASSSVAHNNGGRRVTTEKSSPAER
jgi:hypothetical protein